MSGSDLEAVNTVLETITSDGFYEESTTEFLEIADTVMENATDSATSIYSISSLSLKDTILSLGKTVWKNNTKTEKIYKSSSTTVLTSPKSSNGSTTVSTTVGSQTIEVEMPEKGLFSSSSTADEGFIMVMYEDADTMFQRINDGSSIMSPALEIILSDSTADTSNLTTPIYIEFELKEKIPDKNGITAVFYNTTTSTWSTTGCKTNITSNFTVIAECSHLTAFAIRYESAKYIEEASIIWPTFTGVGIGAIFLIAALLMILLKKPLLSDQLILTHVHLIVTMIVANVLILVAVNTSESSLGVGCYIIAFLANFAWLASHMWLVVEGVVMNQMINKGYKFTVPNQFIRFNAFTFGVSVFLALVGAAVLSAADSYINIPRDYCWLDGTALLAFMWIPIILLTIITLALLVKCYIELNKTSHKHKEIEVEVVKKTILGVLVLMILMDVGWIFAGVAGATTLDPSFTKIQEYCNVMFIVFNIFQGIAVLALFCVLNPKVMGAWKGIVEEVEEKDVERPPSPQDIFLEIHCSESENIRFLSFFHSSTCPPNHSLNRFPYLIKSLYQVAVVDNSDMKSHRSAKSGRSMARSTKSGRSVGDILLMSAIAPLNDADEVS
eukprot:sb/3463109/